MGLLLVAEKAEWLPELGMQCVGAIAHDRKAAALGRPVFRERGDYDVAARLHGVEYAVNVGGPVFRRRQKMKHRAIVPHVVGVRSEGDLRDIGLEPVNPWGTRTQSAPGRFQCGTGQVENGDIAKSVVQQVIDECRCAPAHVDNRTVGGYAGGANQIQREAGVLLVPADRIGGFGGIDLFPVLFGSHTISD